MFTLIVYVLAGISITAINHIHQQDRGERLTWLDRFGLVVMWPIAGLSALAAHAFERKPRA